MELDKLTASSLIMVPFFLMITTVKISGDHRRLSAAQGQGLLHWTVLSPGLSLMFNKHSTSKSPNKKRRRNAEMKQNTL